VVPGQSEEVTGKEAAGRQRTVSKKQEGVESGMMSFLFPEEDRQELNGLSVGQPVGWV
jgi:hypothetical protein